MYNKNNLENPKFTFNKALKFLNTAMEIYQTMMFEDSLCVVRKAAGGISIENLAEKYGLSVDSIKRIVYRNRK